MSRINDESAPCYIRYSLRGLGLFAGLFCLVFGILNMVFNLFGFWCLLFSIVQICLGIFVATSEAAGSPVRICHCITFEKFPTCTGWMDKRPSWIKPIFYILSPMPGMLICTTWFTVFGGGMVILSGVVYAIQIFRNKNGYPSDPSTVRSPQISSPQPQAHVPTVIRIEPRNQTQNNVALSPTGKTNSPTFTKNPMGFSSDKNVNVNANNSKWGTGSRTYLTDERMNEQESTFTSPSTDDTSNSYRYENIQTISGSGNNTTDGGRRVVVDYSNISSQSVHPASDDSPFVTNWERSDIH